MLMPMIPLMEIETMVSPDEVEKSLKRKDNLKEFVYLEKDGKILKFKVKFDHMNIVDSIEKYISDQKQQKFGVLSKKDISKREVPLKFYQYLGKFRLEKNILKTKNYLAPEKTPMLDLLGSKYWNNVVTTETLKRLEQIKMDAMIDDNTLELEIIDLLFDGINVELLTTYETCGRQLNYCIDNVERLLYPNKEALDVLERLKFILISSKENKKYIGKLGLKDKFNEVSKPNKQNQKVKS